MLRRFYTDWYRPDLMAVIAVGDFDPAAVDRVVEAEMARQKVPGVAVAIVRKGQPVVAKGYGLANVEQVRGVWLDNDGGDGLGVEQGIEILERALRDTDATGQRAEGRTV
mgnify:CR=1 FL=1